MMNEKTIELLSKLTGTQRDLSIEFLNATLEGDTKRAYMAAAKMTRRGRAALTEVLLSMQ